jgi:glycosyltransferase involved in cell wall biosynthesis
MVSPTGRPPDRVLHLGPLHSVHLARWAELTRELGLRTMVAGHCRAGLPQAVRDSAVDGLRLAPELGSAQSIGEPVRWSEWLPGVVDELKPDLVHAHWLHGWGAAAAMAGCRPLVVSAWGSDVYLASGPRRRFADLALREADRVLAPSPHLIRALRSRGVPADRLGQVDLGVDLEAFRPLHPSRLPAVRAELGLGDGPVLLSFRAAQPLYNLPLVIEAFRQVQRTHGAAELVIAHGSRAPHPAVAEALAQAARLPGVHVAGDVPHERMPPYFQAADVGISIPTSDGSPRSVWESLATGTPVVLSDLPQLRERIEGNPAVSFVEQDAKAIALALAELIARAPATAAPARAWAAENVDSREQIRLLDGAYQDVRRRSAPRRRGHESNPLLA